MRILFVCTGNICRSPTAEAVVRRMAGDAGLDRGLVLDSAGTGDWHLGQSPDPRAVAAAEKRGYDLSGIRARRAGVRDFRDFDLVIAMTRGHARDLQRLAPHGTEGRLRLMLSYAPDAGRTDVPDPYYGDDRGFETMLDLIERAARGLIADLRAAGTP